jgi:hypothetical protein
METSGIWRLSFHTEKPMAKQYFFLHILVINTLKFVLKIPADIIQFVCSSVLNWSIWCWSCSFTDFFAMVHTRVCQVCFATGLASRSCAVVHIRGMWNLWFGTSQKKFAKFMVWYWPKMNLTSSWHELLRKPIKLQLPHLMDQFHTATYFKSAEILTYLITHLCFNTSPLHILLVLHSLSCQLEY